VVSRRSAATIAVAARGLSFGQLPQSRPLPHAAMDLCHRPGRDRTVRQAGGERMMR